MFFAVHYDATGDLLADVANLRRRLAPERVSRIVGRSVAQQVRRHITAYGQAHPNKLGAPSSGYYQGAVRGTSFTSDANGARVTVSHVGIAQRIYGGVIQARKAKYLTIPVHVQAYNRRARDMQLVPIIRRINGQARMVGLAEPNSGKMMFATKERVRQIGNPRIVPTQAEMEAEAYRALDAEL